MQITFGKKISFRPLVISLIWFLVIGGVFFDLLAGWSWLVGLIIFLWISGIHYTGAIELEFNYIEITNCQIKFYDFGHWYKRFFLVLFGKLLAKQIKLKKINLTDIKYANIIGKKELQNPSLAIPWYG